MYPTICQIGPVTIHSFGVMVAIAVIVCSLLMARESKRIGLKPEEVYDFVFWVVVSGIIGARIFYILLNLSFFMQYPEEILMVHRGGLAWQGGVFLGAMIVMIFMKRKGRNLSVMADFAAPYLALGHAIGRVGCFLNGCCYGKETLSGIYFPVHDAHLHPTQLYEMTCLVVLFFVLKFLQRVFDKIPGVVFGVYLMTASAIRFGVEFFRADHEPLFLQLSVFQYVSIMFFLVGAVILSKVMIKKKMNS